GVAFGAGGDHADFNLQEITDEAEIIHGGFGQLAGILNAVSVLAPAGERFIFGDDVLVLFGERGHFLDGLAFVFVPGANLDFALGIEDVELGDDQRVDTVDHSGVTKNGKVEPAATPRAPGNGAKFFAAFANFLRFEVGHFGGKGAATNARGVGFGDAK